MKRIGLILLLLSTLLLTGCSDAIGTPPPDRKTPMFETAGQYRARMNVENIAAQLVASRLGVSEEMVTVMRSEAVTWQNSCLELPERVNCALVETPGFRVVLQVQGQVFEVHSDYEALIIEIAATNTASIAALQQVIELMVNQANVTPEEIRVISVEPAEWTDTCLGFENLGLCAPAQIPGYRIVLEIANQQFEFHTDLSGSQIASDMDEPEIGRPLLTWQSPGEECFQACFSERAIAYGPCGGEVQVTGYQSAERPAELLTYITTFAPFSADTSEGMVTLNGIGSMPATLEEEQEIALWASDTLSGLIGPLQTSPTDQPLVGEYIGLSMEARNQNGTEIRRVVIARDGKVYASSTNNPQQESMLTDEQLAVYYLWLENYGTESFTLSTESGEWQYTIQIYGSGDQDLSADVRQEIIEFTDGLFADLIVGLTKCGNCNQP